MRKLLLQASFRKNQHNLNMIVIFWLRKTNRLPKLNIQISQQNQEIRYSGFDISQIDQLSDVLPFKDAYLFNNITFMLCIKQYKIINITILVIPQYMQDPKSKLKIHPELPNILKDFCKYVLKQNPTDLIAFSSRYFRRLLQQQNMNKYGQLDYFIFKPLEQIKKLLFNEIIYIWIDSVVDNKQTQTNLRILRQQGFDVITCNNVNQLKSIVASSKNDVTYRIISSVKFGVQVYNEFKSERHIFNIYIFGQNVNQVKELKNKMKVRCITSKIHDLIENIKKNSRNDIQYSILPNFMKVTTKQNTQNNTLINNLRYNINGLLIYKNKWQAKNDFVTLARYLFQEENKVQEISAFQQEIKLDDDGQIFIEWYTKETFYYGLLNNSMRSMKHPMQSAYVRFPFERTFSIIKKSYDLDTNKKPFKAYRKATLDQAQKSFIEANVGEYIQMFGFMSTTTDKSVTDNFLGNTLIIVEVNKENRYKEWDYGYRNISNKSNFDQSEILFNALNVFKILSYTVEDNLSTITLEYGSLAKIAKQSQKNQKQQKIFDNYKYEKQNIGRIKNQGDVLSFFQQYDKSIEYKLKNLQILEDREQNQTAIASMNYSIGRQYKFKGDYNQALEYLQKAYRLFNSCCGYKHVNTADAIKQIGSIFMLKANFSKAKQFYEKAQQIYIDTIGQKHHSTVRVINNMGLIYYKLGDYQNALEKFNKASSICTEIKDEDIDLIADLFNNFGNVYLQKNQFNKSLEYFMKSLNLHLITVGQFHLRTARIFNNIGVIYYNQSELDHAREQYERALKIYRQIIDENNNEIANCINNIGLVYYAQKQCDQALKNYLKAQQIYLKSVGQYHVDTANIMINIGRVYLTQQQHEKALQKYMKALQIYEKLDYNLYQKSKVLNTIASIYQQIDILKAIEFSQKVLQIYDKIFESKNHPQMLEILKKLGTLHMVNREFSLMLEYFQKALMMLDHKMDYKHTEEIMNRIVNVYNMISDSNALENYYNQTCIVLKGIFSEEDEIVIENANKFSERYEFLLSNIEQF